MTRLTEAGLTLKPKKCALFRREIEFLGHVVRSDGIHTQPEKVSRVRDWPQPQSKKQVRSFLGLTAYYQRFIPNYASKAAPLYALTCKDQAFVWSENCQHQFESLKQDLTTAPVLAYPHPTAPYVLDTDASGEAMGAVLSQVIDGHERVIAYGAKAFHKSQRKYCTTLRELAAVITFVKKFRKYLYGRRFIIRTDHASLVWLARFRDADDMLARWLAYLYTYDWEIQHRPGVRHGNADALSRYPVGQRTIGCHRQECRDCGHVEAVVTDPAVPTPVTVTMGHPGNWWLPAMTPTELREAQQADPHVGRVCALLANDIRPPAHITQGATAETRSLLAQWPAVKMRDGLLVRELDVERPYPHTRVQIVAPHSWRKRIFQALHASPQACHLGGERTYQQVRERFYWPGCSSAIRRWCHKCLVCARAKPGPGKGRAPLHQDTVSAPMERVAVDILGPLPETEEGYEYILVACDYYTKWVQAWPLPDHRAATVAQALMTDLFLPFGVPMQLHSDQGREFESRLIAELCRSYDIDKTRTTPYRPQSDGLVERFNRTVLQMLRTFVKCTPTKWATNLPFCTAAYRASVHESTGCTPNLLMMGREVTTPADIMFGSVPRTDRSDCPVGYVEQVRQAHWAAHEFVRTHVGRAARRQKRAYDRSLKPRSFEVGDYVLVLDVPEANRKLGVPWAGPYRVIQKINDLLYKIAMGFTGRRTLHVDMIKPAPPPSSGTDDDVDPQPGPSSSGAEAPVPLDDVSDQQLSPDPQPNSQLAGTGRPRRTNQLPGWRMLDLFS